MKIGFLDFGEIPNNSNAISVIFDSIEVATNADELGFSRYWIAEHHEDTIAFRNPELIINLIAGYTTNIRVGAAGVLLPLCPPLQVAQRYKLLNNLFSNRIDLGLAKGITNSLKNIELTDGSNINSNIINHNDRCLKVAQYLNDNNEDFITHPIAGYIPEIWILTTGGEQSSNLIINNEFSFSFSLFHDINKVSPPMFFENIKNNFFKKNGYLPKCNIAISVFLAKNQKEIDSIKENTKNIYVNIATTKECLIAEINKYKTDYGAEEIIIVNLGRGKAEKILLQKLLADNILSRSNYNNEK